MPPISIKFRAKWQKLLGLKKGVLPYESAGSQEKVAPNKVCVHLQEWLNTDDLMLPQDCLLQSSTQCLRPHDENKSGSMISSMMSKSWGNLKLQRIKNLKNSNQIKNSSGADTGKPQSASISTRINLLSYFNETQNKQTQQKQTAGFTATQEGVEVGGRDLLWM